MLLGVRLNRQHAHTVELRVPSELGFEKVAMNAAATLAETMGFSSDRVDDLRTAVSEACVNAMEHGNSGRANLKVLVTLRVQHDELQVNVRDRGACTIIPTEAPDLEYQLEHSERTRGWGLFLIERLVDEVHYRHEADGGNTVQMIFRLNPELMRVS